MSKLKSINKKAVEHNLATALKQAYLKSDVELLHKATQDIVDAGYELEDMKILPGMMSIIMHALIETKFVPDYSKAHEAMKKSKDDEEFLP